MEPWYIYLTILKVVGKIENHVPYIYKRDEGWIPHIIPMECSMGNNINFEEITVEEAERKIKELENQ